MRELGWGCFGRGGARQYGGKEGKVRPGWEEEKEKTEFAQFFYKTPLLLPTNFSCSLLSSSCSSWFIAWLSLWSIGTTICQLLLFSLAHAYLIYILSIYITWRLHIYIRHNPAYLFMKLNSLAWFKYLP